MKNFKNKKISEKITSSILIIVLISNLVLCAIGVAGIAIVNMSAKQIYSDNLVPLTPIYKFSNDFASVRVQMRELLINNGDNSDSIKSMANSFDDMDKQLNEYGKQISSTEEKSNFARIQDDYDKYQSTEQYVVSYVKTGEKQKAQELLNGKIATDMASAITQAFLYNTTQADQNNKTNTTIFCIALAAMVAFVIASILFAKKYGKRIAKNISEPIEKMVLAANSISEGNLNVDVSVDSNDETGVLAEAFQKIVDSLKLLTSDVKLLIVSAKEGKLDTRIDLNRHNGEYRNVIKGVNDMLDTVKAPLDVASEFIDRLADGEHQNDIDNTYKGYYAVLIDNLNRVRNSINILEVEAAKLSEAGKNGQLDVRGDEAKLKGVYAEIINGVNQTFDAIKNPLDVAAAFINKMAHGESLDKLDNTYKGYYAALIGNLNDVRESLLILTEESVKLAQAGKDGNLDVRGDTTKVQGAYAEIIGDFNQAFDSIATPLNEAGVVLEKMAVNDYKSKMSDNWKGMLNDLSKSINSVRASMLNVQNVFDKISQGDISPLDEFKAIGKRSENDELMPAGVKMMQSIHDLIEESNMLANAASEGNLDVKGNKDKFEGGYKQIIKGINKTMEAVTAPIEESSQVLQSVAQGNMTVSMTGEYKGEYNKIKLALNHAIDSFNEVLGNIKFSASQVATGSKQVSDASQNLSQGATEQASSVEELTSSIAEVASQTKQNATNSSQASKLTSEVKTEAENGNAQMKTMLSAMNEINVSSSNISKIIKVIDDIAFQTNILALNAAVEAARAGQYGKGFAVVAEEVRNLAAKSADAAKETTGLIEGSFAKVEAGTKIANETALKLEDIFQKAGKSADIVNEIAVSSNEQATAISQIDKGLNQVSSVVQTNSATAEESAASSEELSGQAEMLNQIVDQFKIKNSKYNKSEADVPQTNSSGDKEPDENSGIVLTEQYGKY